MASRISRISASISSSVSRIRRRVARASSMRPFETYLLGEENEWRFRKVYLRRYSPARGLGAEEDESNNNDGAEGLEDDNHAPVPLAERLGCEGRRAMSASAPNTRLLRNQLTVLGGSEGDPEGNERSDSVKVEARLAFRSSERASSKGRSGEQGDKLTSKKVARKRGPCRGSHCE